MDYKLRIFFIIALLPNIISFSLFNLKHNYNYNKLISSILIGGSIFINDPVYSIDNKSYNLNQDALINIIKDDITIRQALITADFTRTIYNEQCTFQDEIDIYPIDQYVKGTKALFDPKYSHVDLISDVNYNNHKFMYKFSEILAFNIPFKPKVSLTGRVELTQDNDGLIISSREFWDQPVVDVLKTITF